MLRLILGGLTVLFLLAPAFSQEKSAAPISIQATQVEWQFVLQACEAAKWASRIQFGDACEPLKARIVAAEESAKTADKPAPKSSSVDPGFGTPSPGLDEGSSAAGAK